LKEVPSLNDQLLAAVSNRNVPVAEVSRLLASRADPWCKDDQGQYAFHVAASCGHEALPRLLAACDDEDRSYRKKVAALKELTSDGGERTVWTLVAELGHAHLIPSATACDLHRADGRNETPMDVAIEHDQADVVRALRLRGVPLPCADDNGDYLVHLAVKTKNVRLLQLLARVDDDLNQANRDGLSPMHLAVLQRDPSLIKVLHDLGTSTDSLAPLRSGVLGTPAHLAVELGGAASFIALANHGADMRRGYVILRTSIDIPGPQGRGPSPLQYAAARDRWQLLREAHAAGIPMDVRNLLDYAPAGSESANFLRSLDNVAAQKGAFAMPAGLTPTPSDRMLGTNLARPRDSASVGAGVPQSVRPSATVVGGAVIALARVVPGRAAGA